MHAQYISDEERRELSLYSPVLDECFHLQMSIKQQFRTNIDIIFSMEQRAAQITHWYEFLHLKTNDFVWRKPLVWSPKMNIIWNISNKQKTFAQMPVKFVSKHYNEFKRVSPKWKDNSSKISNTFAGDRQNIPQEPE